MKILPDAHFDLRLTAISLGADSIHLFELRAPDEACLPPFTAGAHIDIHLPNGTMRQYSLCNSQTERHRYVVGVKRDPASTTKMMTAYLVALLAEKDPKVLDEIVTFSEEADKTSGSTSEVKAGEKLPVGDVSRVEAAIADVRKRAEGDDLQALKTAIDDLQHASHAIAQTLYANQSTGSKGSGGSTGSSGSGSNVKDGEVIDAEYDEGSSAA